MNSKSVEILTLAGEYLRRGWCRETQARDRRGAWACYRGPDAVAWCWVGAVDAAAYAYALLHKERCELSATYTWAGMLSEQARQYTKAIAVDLRTIPADPRWACVDADVAYNDAEGRTQAEVIAANNRAIELANNAKEGKDG